MTELQQSYSVTGERTDSYTSASVPAIPSDLRTRIGLILNGSVAMYIKPSDVTYAKRLLSQTKAPTASELSWLRQFVAWYGDTPLDRVREWAEANGIVGATKTTAAVTKAKAVVQSTVATAKAAIAPSKAEAAAEAEEAAPPVRPTPFMRYGFIGFAAIALIGAGTAYTLKRIRE